MTMVVEDSVVGSGCVCCVICDVGTVVDGVDGGVVGGGGGYSAYHEAFSYLTSPVVLLVSTYQQQWHPALSFTGGH